MNRQSLPGMIRDLLTTGDMESRLRNAEWIIQLVDLYAPTHDESMTELLGLQPPWTADSHAETRA